MLKAEPEPAIIEDEHYARALALEVGQWLEWQGEDDAWVRGKLSWRSEVSNNCIFVNRKGMKVAEMVLNDIAILFRENNARLLEDLEKPLMDRALNAMLGALKDTSAEPSQA